MRKKQQRESNAILSISRSFRPRLSPSLSVYKQYWRYTRTRGPLFPAGAAAAAAALIFVLFIFSARPTELARLSLFPPQHWCNISYRHIFPRAPLLYGAACVLALRPLRHPITYSLLLHPCAFYCATTPFPLLCNAHYTRARRE